MRPFDRPFDEDAAGAQALRDLAAVDAVLAGERVPAELAELERLTVDVRAERPVLSQQAAARLDALAQRGFRPDDDGHPASREATGRRHPRRKLRWALGPAVATAACLFIALVGVLSSGVLSSGGGSEDSGGPIATAPIEPSPPSGSGSGTGAAPETMSRGSRESRESREAAPSPSAAAGGAADAQSLASPPPAAGRLVPRAGERKVVHQAALTLAPARADVEDVADGVVRVTDRYRGFVLSSAVSGGEDAPAGASLELRLPSSRLQPALADLSELAHVRSRTQSTEDVTAAYTSLRSRLAAALAERQGLLRQLARAQTPNETASVRARLRLAERRVTRLRSRLRSQRERVDYAAVAVSVEADDRKAKGDGAWTPGDALNDALSVLGTALGITLVTLAVLVPLGLIALAVALTRRRMVRLRREHALDASSQG